MSLTNGVSNLIAALQYGPHVSKAVIAVESAVGSSVPGATKKQLVMAAISAAAKVGEGVPEAHVRIISELIDIAVGLLNAAGLFGAKATALVLDSAPAK